MREIQKSAYLPAGARKPLDDKKSVGYFFFA
jgi:hypothetical protein